MVPGESDLFYQKLKGFSNFNGINDKQNFAPVPSDWTVIITDVKGSTKAIEAGKYRDVNTVGAAAIACVQNAMPDLEFPFVFGGDGATLLIPKIFLMDVTRALASLKSLSERNFGLSLRVGAVPVSELFAKGISVLVAKYCLIGKKSVAIFTGGGLVEAEKIVKFSETNEIPTDYKTEPNLKGLSCRWKAIPSQNGKVLSLLIVARTQDKYSSYQKVLDNLNFIFSGKIELANPANASQKSYKSLNQCLRDEKRYHKSNWSLAFLYRIFEIFFTVLVFKLRIPFLIIRPQKYIDSLETHSDYRKFDDALRMVLDCTRVQIDRIRKMLDELLYGEEIHYGMHESDTSLMTCFVQGMSEGDHIHFIDGGDGGYAMAAKQLKGQMKLGK